MLRIDRKSHSLTRLDRASFADAGHKERSVQAKIRESPEVFFAEMGETLLLVGEEVRPSELVNDRIDLLALDEHGSAVVIELKRGSDRLQPLQALTYAAMMAGWSAEQLVAERARLTAKSSSDAKDDISGFLPIGDLSAINQSQRIILIAEDFDWEVLATAEWLNERYGVDIRCFRLVLSVDGDNQYLNCTCIYPPPELSAHVRRRRQPTPVDEESWANWDEALGAIENGALVAFFKREIAAGAENRLRNREVIYRHKGRRTLFVGARQKHAYVWQRGRFNGDIDFWKGKLSHDSIVKAVNDGECVSLTLVAPEDFEAFGVFVHQKLDSIEFVEADEAGPEGQEAP